jgi:hypothetical protein
MTSNSCCSVMSDFEHTAAPLDQGAPPFPAWIFVERATDENVGDREQPSSSTRLGVLLRLFDEPVNIVVGETGRMTRACS